MTRIRAVTSHTLVAVVRAGLVATLVAGLLAGTAFAAKGGGGKPGGGGTSGSGSITAVRMVYDQNANGAPNWADQITFTFTSSNSKPYITLTCSTSAGMVASSSHLMYTPNIWNDPGIFSLQSPSWMGGAASCTAVLYGTTSTGGSVRLASMTFGVAA